MIASKHRQSARTASQGRRLSTLTLLATTLTAAFAALVVAITITAGAVSAVNRTTIATTTVPALEERVAVGPRGRTLYTLSGETAHHLLCVSRRCTRLWPPLTVASRKVALRAGRGLEGRLGTLRRRGGALQVTLRGLPLYRFHGDHARHQANGEGIASFGGTWHAAPAAGRAPSASPPPPSSPPTTATPPTSTAPTSTAPEYAPGYGY
jgi:predicted lipoprotein with Yx(FWY)xxD motif